MDVTISIDKREEDILTRLATKNRFTLTEYCQNIVISFAKNQIRGLYKREMNAKTDAQLETLFGKVSDLSITP